MVLPQVVVSLSASDLEERPLAEAETMPSLWYTDPAFHAWDMQCIMARSWQMLAAEQQIPNPGDVMAVELAGNPVLLVRDNAGEIRGFYNVCRHRGGPLADKQASCKVLRCGYHGWSYDLTGRLIGTPEFEGVQNFEPEAFGLQPVPVTVWEGLIFASLSEDISPLSEVMAGIAQRIAPIDLSRLKFTTRVEYDLACNWKVYMDNYLEGYHINAVHPELAEILDYRNYVTELAPYYSLQYSPIRAEGNFYSQGEAQAFYYCMYPNMMLNIMPGRLQSNLIVPIAHNRTKVIFDYFYDEAVEDVEKLMAEDLPFSEVIQQQDIDICEQVQRGLESQSYDRGRFSVKRESGVHHFQNLIRRAYREGQALTQRDGLTRQGVACR